MFNIVIFTLCVYIMEKLNLKRIRKTPVIDVDHLRSDTIFAITALFVLLFKPLNVSNQAINAFVVLFMQSLLFLYCHLCPILS